MQKRPRTARKCRHHGETEFVQRQDGRWTCVICRKAAVMARRRSLKEKLVALHGGECVICGYDSFVGALDFHHVDPKTKEFSLSHTTYSWKRMVREAEKCVLLCANHHREAEAGMLDLSDFAERRRSLKVKQGAFNSES